MRDFAHDTNQERVSRKAQTVIRSVLIDKPTASIVEFLEAFRATHPEWKRVLAHKVHHMQRDGDIVYVRSLRGYALRPRTLRPKAPRKPRPDPLFTRNDSGFHPYGFRSISAGLPSLGKRR